MPLHRHGAKVLIALCVGVGVTGCSSTPPPRAELAAADIAVEEAKEADAADYAAGPFILAQDKLERAREAFEEDFTRARRLAEQAEVDAQFAEAKARSEIAEARATELRESIRILREEIERQESS